MAPVVFVGPSLDPSAVKRAMPAARVEPPAARGDIERMHGAGASAILLIDGVFGHQLAVPPSEIIDAISGGARIYGASSLGAIRAAECWPAGMLGLGAAYTLYRFRVISGDDEVAVATDPDTGFAALSVALINFRYACLKALRRGLLGRRDARAVLEAAKRTHFPERQWQPVFAAANVSLRAELRAVCEATDVKRRDALRAVEHFATVAEPDAGRSPAPKRGQRPRGARARYSGHDPHLGFGPDALRDMLTRWLMGSGRYRRYVRSGAVDLTCLQDELWLELERSRGLVAERMRWYAVRRIGSLGPPAPDPAHLAAAELEVATEHGFRDWRELVNCHELTIPREWIVDACRSLAAARTHVSRHPGLRAWGRSASEGAARASMATAQGRRSDPGAPTRLEALPDGVNRLTAGALGDGLRVDDTSAEPS